MSVNKIPTTADLRWIQVRRRLWSDRNTRAFIRGGYDSVVYGPEGSAQETSAVFAKSLPGLRGLWLAGNIVDDADALSLQGLQVLLLENNGRNAINLEPLAESLLALTVRWRRGIESISRLASLESLTIDRFGAPDLTILSNLSNLSSIRLDVGRSHSMSLNGIDDMKGLKKLIVEGAVLDGSLALLPASITELALNGVKNLDLELVCCLPNLRHLRVENCYTIPSIAALEGHPKLQDITIWNTDISDQDTSPLARIPHLTGLGLDRRATFSHDREHISLLRRRHGLPELDSAAD